MNLKKYKMTLNKLKKIKRIKNAYDAFRSWSIRKGLKHKFFLDRINSFDIDITGQYTALELDTEYLKLKVRALHAFQYSLLCIAAEGGQNLNIIDIGDSNGTHCQYLQKTFLGVKTLSINIDPEAVKRIKKKGLNVILISAERSKNIKSLSLFKNNSFIMMLQTLEHLPDPINILNNLTFLTDKLVVTVPYVKRSRIGMHCLRDPNYSKEPTSENTHIFELSPEDWKLLFDYTGWKVAKEDVHWQYPKRWPLISWLLKLYWRRFDFEGFWGVILRKK